MAAELEVEQDCVEGGVDYTKMLVVEQHWQVLVQPQMDVLNFGLKFRNRLERVSVRVAPRLTNLVDVRTHQFARQNEALVLEIRERSSLYFKLTDIV